MYEIHRVKQGETLKIIADKLYKGKFQEIIDHNKLKNENTLKEGQRLVLIKSKLEYSSKGIKIKINSLIMFISLVLFIFFY
jgi:LysM repeat protein